MFIGEIKENKVRVSDPREGNRLYGKNCYGVPISGGGLLLDLIEATYLVENNRLKVMENEETVGLKEMLIRSSKAILDFEMLFTAFRDLRNRGFIVKRGLPFDFNLYPRGAYPGKDPSTYVVKIYSEGVHINTRSLLEMAKRAEHIKKRLLLALVDEDSELTYYLLRTTEPRGEISLDPALSSIHGVDFFPTKQKIVGIPPGPVQVMAKGSYPENYSFFGKDFGKSLELSLVEALYLVRKGLLTGDVGSDTQKSLEKTISSDDLIIRDIVFTDLRNRGLVPKTGFKYGTHFRAYSSNPSSSHAEFLIHGYKKGAMVAWPDISSCVRLAHGVKKLMLFSIVDAKNYLKFPDRNGPHNLQDAEYIELTRFKPS